MSLETRIRFIATLVICSSFILLPQLSGQASKFELKDIEYVKTTKGIDILSNQNGTASLLINGEEQELVFENGRASIPMDVTHAGQLFMLKNPSSGSHQLLHASKKKDGSLRVRNIPMWLSIVPPLVAILLALIFKEVVISLFIGIWAGAFIAGGLRFESLYYFFISFLNTVKDYVITALNDSGHLAIIVFSLLIGGMVAIISKNGGMSGVVKSLSRFAKTTRSAQFITWLLGVAIFFDDYANTLIVGNTMRSVTDRFKISREKLAYIVDSTAAPVAAVAFITTWIGAELGYIDSGIQNITGPLSEMTSYSIFLSSLKYSYYPGLTLVFILILIYTKKDYGQMLKAERRAFQTGQVSPAATESEDEPNMEDLSPVSGAPLIWINAVLPVLTVIFMTMFGLVDTGIAATYDALTAQGIASNGSWTSVWSNMSALNPDGGGGFFIKLGQLIGSSDSYGSLLWASLSGVVVAIIMTVSQRIIKLFDTMHYMATGFKTMLPALIILTLAWSLAISTNQLHTADYLTSLLRDSVNPYLMPPIIFVLAAVIAFSTGSSWSTMAILYPIAIPTTWAVCQANGIDPQVGSEIVLNVIATVLAASVLGDHCSPISDTTILSSLASDCNHIDHVRTQLPYALTVGGVCLVAGTISTMIGGGWLPAFFIFVTSVGVLFLIVHRFGKNARQVVSS